MLIKIILNLILYLKFVIFVVKIIFYVIVINKNINLYKLQKKLINKIFINININLLLKMKFIYKFIKI